MNYPKPASQIPWFPRAIIGLAMLAAFAPSSSAQAAACTRDIQCSAGELCIAGICEVPTHPTSCQTQRDCGHWFKVCEDNICRYDAVVCTNPAGECTFRDLSAATCSCWDGSAFDAGWDSNGTGDATTTTMPADEVIAEKCVQRLESGCGTELPPIPVSCTGTRLETCEHYQNATRALANSCGNDKMVAQNAALLCCRDLDQNPTSEPLYACLAAIDVTDATDCTSAQAQAQACYPDISPCGDLSVEDCTTGTNTVTITATNTTTATGTTPTQQDGSNQDGCSVHKRISPWPVVGLGLMLVGIRRRRRLVGVHTTT